MITGHLTTKALDYAHWIARKLKGDKTPVFGIPTIQGHPDDHRRDSIKPAFPSVPVNYENRNEMIDSLLGSVSRILNTPCSGNPGTTSIAQHYLGWCSQRKVRDIYSRRQARRFLKALYVSGSSRRKLPKGPSAPVSL